MQGYFNIFVNDLKNNNIKFNRENLTETIQSFDFLFAPLQLNDIGEYKKIYHNFHNSQFIIIDYYTVSEKNSNESYFIISFQNKIILIIDPKLKSEYLPLFLSNPSLNICFINKSKEIFDSLIKVKYNEIFFPIKMPNLKIYLSKANKANKKIWNIIYPSLIAYFIKNSSLKIKTNRFKSFIPIQNRISKDDFEENDYIKICGLQYGAITYEYLVYHIKKEELLILKEFVNENMKTKYERNIKNYSILDHPLIATFHGKCKTKDSYMILQESINSKELVSYPFESINKLNLQYNEKLKLIFELMLIIEYIHINELVIRFLFPVNLMLDENKNIILTTLDHIVSHDYCISSITKTHSFFSDFFAPEIDTNFYSYECDIYTLGIMIHYIIKDDHPYKINKNEQIHFENLKIQEIFDKCIKTDPKERPTIKQLISEFYLEFHEYIQIDDLADIYRKYFRKDTSSIFYDYKMNYKIGQKYLNGDGVEIDIIKGIEYLKISANQNYKESQIKLGQIYYEEKYVQRDMNKSIHYLQLASQQNSKKAQYYLGLIYYENKYIERDINKTIYYFELAAKQNCADAQFNLGVLYDEGKFVPQDLNKAIYYLELAANQNHISANFNLGYLYLKYPYNVQNINAGIHYYINAANMNHYKAQFNLGLIYYEGKYVQQDIEKSIFYYSLASNQNDHKAQFNLGTIYYYKRDINNAIKYLTLSANQNDLEALYNLGIIYYDIDINNSIYYLSLAANQGHQKSQCFLKSINH